MTLLFRGLSIRPGFLGSLWRLVSPVGPRLLALFRQAPLVPPRHRSSRLLLLPRVSLARGRRRARVRLPFPPPLEAPAAQEVKEREPGRSRHEGVPLPVRVGGCLAQHWRQWQAIGAETWVVTVLRDGYRVPFKDSPPPLSRTPVSFPTYRAGSPRAQALRQEVEAMLAKGALEIARDPGPSFYSRLFLVEKATGGWRPVIDLSHLNDFVQLTSFKMETVASVLLSVREGDFLASLDLKDAYFQIPIHGSSRKLLRFMSEGTVYQFKALCFGLSTAPQGLRGSVSLGTLPRDQTAPLPGRLVGSFLFGEESQTIDQGAPLALSHLWDCDKREVGSRALAVCEVSRYDHRYRYRQGVSVSGASREIPVGSGEILYHAISPGSALAGDSRSPGIAGTVGSSRSSSDALLAVASEDAVVPRVRPSLASGGFAGGSETGSVLVDGEGSPVDGGSIRDTCAGSSPVFGRVFVGVGRSPPRSKRVWGVVRPGEVAAHQSSRNEGPVPGSSGISGRCQRSPCDRDVHQLDGGGVRQQTRGHGFPGPVFVDQPSSEMDGEFRRPSRCKVSARREQRPGRYTQPSRASCGDRVVSPPSGGEVTSSRVGQSVDRPVCDVPQREAAPVLLASPGSPGSLRGCVSPSLGRPGSVRVPSLSSGRSGDRPRPRVVACRYDSGRASLAREGMVCRLAASADPTTPGAALLGQAAPAAPLQPVPSRHPRVETLKRHYRKSGFSGRAARVLSGVLRESSSQLYQSRWKIFCGWCRGRGVAPVNATVPVVVDFLIHLRQDKGLSVSAVKGYCSALNSVLALKGRDLAASREITTLLRSFARSVNPVELRPPAWDVSLVLQSLTGAPYEPLRTCEERFLAQKTLFLLALASAKCIGELHALSYRVSHTRNWGEVSFSFVTGFVAKTQDPSSLAPRFEGFSVPALPNARNNRNGRLLCPVRAVKVYLDRTAPHRPQCEWFFVTAGRSKKEIAKTTVSFWLRKTISRAYELSETALPVPTPRARETRGIAPSLLFQKNFAVDQVLKAGTWRRHTTFTRHYLRDIAHKSLDTFHLGPVVAAQALV